MGSEAESEPSSTPKLQLFSMPPHLLDLPEPSGTLTPPLQTSASVPFRWEEEPGKPRPCTDLILAPTRTCLELPPRLAMVDSGIIITKTPSPTTVLDGPVEVGKSIFSSASFRFPRERRRHRQRQLSFDFDSSCSSSRSPNEESGCGGLQQQQLLLGSRTEQLKGSSRRLFGSFRLPGALKPKRTSASARGSCVISPSSSSSMDTAFFEDMGDIGEKKGKRMRRNGSFSSLSHVTRSHFWASIYEGLKQVVVPWKIKRRSKKEDFTL